MKKFYNNKNIIWWIVVGWWIVPLYYIYVWWWLTPIKSIINKNKKKENMHLMDKEVSLENVKVIDLYVAGSNYRYKEIHGLMTEEYQYYNNKDKFDGFTDKEMLEYEGMKFYEFPITSFSDVELKMEPKNPYDSNAIKIVVNNYHIGYIPSENTERVRKIIKDIKNIEVTVRKGRYKMSETFMEKPKIFKSDYSAGIKIYY